MRHPRWIVQRSLRIERVDARVFDATPEGRGASRIVGRLRDAGHQAWLAGGCVRDALLGDTPHDFDVATSATPEEVHAAFPKVVDTGIRFGTVTVVDADVSVEVTTFRGESSYLDGRRPSSVSFGVTLEEDAQRRDFTINALYGDPARCEILDPVGGIDDLRDRRLRAVGEPGARFDEDALRLLRLVRFATRFQARIDPATERAARARPHRLTLLSAERVREELVKMWARADAAEAMRGLDALGFLDVVLPEVGATRGVPQPPQYHPEGDVLVHTIDVLARLQRRTVALSLAALFHDVGKTRTLTVSDRIRFHGHEHVSCELLEPRLRSLRFSNAEIEQVLDLVVEHIRFGSFAEWRRAKQLRFLSKPNARDHLTFHRADRQSGGGSLETHDLALRELDRIEREPPPRAPLLTGNDLRELGYPPGPAFREILGALRDEQLEGSLETRDAAVAWVVGKFPMKPQGPSSR